MFGWVFSDLHHRAIRDSTGQGVTGLHGDADGLQRRRLLGSELATQSQIKSTGLRREVSPERHTDGTSRLQF